MPIADVASPDMKVFFAKTYDIGRAVEPPALIIVPDPDPWNDYGLRLYARMYVVSEASVVRFQVAMMFEGQADTDVFLRKLFGENGDLIDASEMQHSFVSLLRDGDNYAALVERLGFDAAIIGLRGIHDIVLGEIEGDEAALRLRDSLNFGIGMTRSATHYAAMRRGGQGLRRSPIAVADDAAHTFEITAVLPSSSEPVVLTFDLEHDDLFRDRCCVLIGRNGVGKTQLLTSLVRGLANLNGGADFGDSRPRPRRLLVFSSVATDSYPRMIAPWSGLDYEYHPLVADSSPLGRAFITAVVDCLRDGGARAVVSEGGFDRWEALKAALLALGILRGLLLPIKQEAQGEFYHVREVEGASFIEVYRNFNEKRLGLLFNSIDWNRAAIVVDDDGHKRILSSGELALANFFAQAIAAIERGCLLLFDEPETHLHPAYISLFMDALQDLLERSLSASIIATHSSYVVREVPRQRVNILHRATIESDDALGAPRYIVVVDTPRLQTFGSNISDISQFVFNDAAVSHRYQKVLAEWAQSTGKELGVKEIVKRYATKLNPETLSFIQRSMAED